MPYIEGFVAAVPTANREAYIESAKLGAEYFKKPGATRVTECWGDDVLRGEVTDFFRATQAKDDETVIFSWIEYPDKATRDAANEKMSADPEMMNMDMPFDGKRCSWPASSRCWTTRPDVSGVGVLGSPRHRQQHWRRNGAARTRALPGRRDRGAPGTGFPWESALVGLNALSAAE